MCVSISVLCLCCVYFFMFIVWFDVCVGQSLFVCVFVMLFVLCVVCVCGGLFVLCCRFACLL